MVENKLRGTDRVLSLSQIDGKAPISSTGMTDRRLFTGETQMHGVMDPQTCLWSIRYEGGKLPIELEQRFTSFQALLKHAQEYFQKRNVKIEELI